VCYNFRHECTSGYYRVSAYYLAKLLCDIIPLRIIPLIAFSVISYFMVGLQMNVNKFFIFFLNLFLTNMAASGMGFVISASVRVFAIANLFVSLAYIVMMVFGGLLVNIQTMPSWLSWLQYISIIRYSLNTLSINELQNLTLYVYNVNGTQKLFSNSTAGQIYLDTQGIKHTTAWDLWANQVALGIISVVMIILAYVMLRLNVRYFIRKK